MEQLIAGIQAYKEDNLHVIITEDMIKGAIESHIDLLVEEIKKELDLL